MIFQQKQKGLAASAQNRRGLGHFQFSSKHKWRTKVAAPIYSVKTSINPFSFPRLTAISIFRTIFVLAELKVHWAQP